MDEGVDKLSYAISQKLNAAIDKKIGKAVDKVAKSSRYTGQVTRVDNHGQVWAVVPGYDEEIPISSCSVDVSKGDSVPVVIENYQARIDGNYSQPPIGTQKATVVVNNVVEPLKETVEASRQAIEAIQRDVDIVDERTSAAIEQIEEDVETVSTTTAAAIAAVETDISELDTTMESFRTTTNAAISQINTDLATTSTAASTALTNANNAAIAASQAQAAAEAAQEDIDEQQEYFWHDALGAHVLSDLEYEPVTPAGTENPSSEGWYELDSATGTYSLTTDISVDPDKTYYQATTIRYRQDMKGAGTEFFELDESAGTQTSVALFGGSGARIGKPYISNATDNESHLEMDYHSLQIVDKDNDVFFHVEDMRGHDGLAYYTDTFIGDGTTSSFYVSAHPSISAGTPTPIVYIDSTQIYDLEDPLLGNITFSLDPHTRVLTFWNVTGGSISSVYIPANHADISITYAVLSNTAKSFSFGSRDTTHIGPLSSAFGYDVLASGEMSFAEGDATVASGFASHAEGTRTKAAGINAHAEGRDTEANGEYSHAEGQGSIASGECSHASGYYTTATKEASVAFGRSTHAIGLHQFVTGRWNDPLTSRALVIGNGTSSSARSNAFVIDWSGSAIGQAMAGMVQMFAGSTAPSGWLICDGSAVSRTTYATLFAVIGTTFGSGDGSTTFNLPDMRGRMPVGVGATTDEAGESVTVNLGAEFGFWQSYMVDHYHKISHTHGTGSTTDTYFYRGTQAITRSAQGSSGTTNSNVLHSTAAISRMTATSDASTTNSSSVTGTYASTATSYLHTMNNNKTGYTNWLKWGNVPPALGLNFIICTGKTS